MSTILKDPTPWPEADEGIRLFEHVPSGNRWHLLRRSPAEGEGAIEARSATRTQNIFLLSELLVRTCGPLKADSRSFKLQGVRRKHLQL
eukprot:1975522-Amphidinium_carterae.2